MRVPNALITIQSNKNHGAVKQQPEWFAALYREVWGRRVDPVTGVKVEPLPDTTPEALRYSEYDSVLHAEVVTIRYFSGGNADQENEIAQIFRRLFPDGLGKVIGKLLVDDAKRLKDLAASRAAPAVAHESFLAAGCTELEALAFQGHGWYTANDVPKELVKVAEVIPDAVRAVALLEAFQALRPPVPARPNPFGAQQQAAGATALTP